MFVIVSVSIVHPVVTDFMLLGISVIPVVLVVAIMVVVVRVSVTMFTLELQYALFNGSDDIATVVMIVVSIGVMPTPQLSHVFIMRVTVFQAEVAMTVSTTYGYKII